MIALTLTSFFQDTPATCRGKCISALNSAINEFTRSINGRNSFLSSTQGKPL